MNLRWYEHWLRRASNQEVAGLIQDAIECLNRAEKHTGDPDELFHLRLWRQRLQDSSNQQNKSEGRQ